MGRSRGTFKFTKGMSMVENTSEVFYTGYTGTTHFGDEYTIIGKLAKECSPNARNCYYVLAFKNGYTGCVLSTAIRTDGIRIPYSKTFSGVGYLGEGMHVFSTEGRATKEGAVWGALLSRLYNKKTKEKHPCYDGATVDPRWHNFQNFCEDIQELEGYAEWKNSKKSREYALDKDKYGSGNKHYSKETCCFIPFAENTTLAKVTGKAYEGYNTKDNTISKFYNQREFCRIHHLAQGNVTTAIHKKDKQVKGWYFREMPHPYIPFSVPKKRILIATRLCDNYIEELCNLRAFSKKYNLHHSSINRMLRGDTKQHKGWTFKIKEEQEEKIVGNNK